MASTAQQFERVRYSRIRSKKENKRGDAQCGWTTMQGYFYKFEENLQKTRYFILEIPEGQDWELEPNPIFAGNHPQCGACLMRGLPAIME